MTTFSETFPQVKKGAVISAVDLINGIGYYAGLRRIAVEGQPACIIRIMKIKWLLHWKP